MTSKISAGIKISVEAFYQPEFSNPANSEFMFAYRITIENNNVFPVKLRSRHWHIFDSYGSLKEVEGEGVVGDQPVLDPGQSYQYVSGCPLVTDMGTMHGSFQMQRLDNGSFFDVEIPKFQLIAPFKNN
jgi:ApaG protein